MKCIVFAVAFSVAAAVPAYSFASGEPGEFDYYVLALSWAPQYCYTHPNDEAECAPGKKYGFVLHGLWPQYNVSWPQNCSTHTLTDQEEQEFASIYPSPTLMVHEWTKHGTCSGLNPEEYFTLSDHLRNSVRIPTAYQKPSSRFKTTSAKLAQAFLNANSWMVKGSVLAVCSNKYLSEIQICFDKSGTYSIACSASETSSAKSSCPSYFTVDNVE